MYFLVAVIVGLVIGSVVAYLKHQLIWLPYAQSGSNDLGLRVVISNAVNLVVLLAVFLLRRYWHYSFEVTILAVAVSLVTLSRILTQRLNKK